MGCLITGMMVNHVIKLVFNEIGLLLLIYVDQVNFVNRVKKFNVNDDNLMNQNNFRFKARFNKVCLNFYAISVNNYLLLIMNRI